MITKRVLKKLTNDTEIKSMNIIEDTLQITVFDKKTNEASMKEYSLCELTKKAKIWAAEQRHYIQTSPYLSEGTIYWKMELQSPDHIHFFNPSTSEEEGVLFICEWMIEHLETGRDLRKENKD